MWSNQSTVCIQTDTSGRMQANKGKSQKYSPTLSSCRRHSKHCTLYLGTRIRRQTIALLAAGGRSGIVIGRVEVVMLLLLLLRTRDGSWRGVARRKGGVAGSSGRKSQLQIDVEIIIRFGKFGLRHSLNLTPDDFLPLLSSSRSRPCRRRRRLTRARRGSIATPPLIVGRRRVRLGQRRRGALSR